MPESGREVSAQPAEYPRNYARRRREQRRTLPPVSIWLLEKLKTFYQSEKTFVGKWRIVESAFVSEVE